MQKNVAGQFVSARLNALADGSAVTTGTTTVYVTGDNGSQATGTGAAVHKGNGEWAYSPPQAESNYNAIAFTFVNSLAVGITVNVATVPANFATLAITNAQVIGTSTLTGTPQTGDAYALMNGSGGNLSTGTITTIRSGLMLAASYVAPDNADIVTALSDLVMLLARTDPTTSLAAVKAVTDALAPLIASGGFTANALALSPTGSSNLSNGQLNQISSAVLTGFSTRAVDASAGTVIITRSYSVQPISVTLTAFTDLTAGIPAPGVVPPVALAFNSSAGKWISPALPAPQHFYRAVLSLDFGDGNPPSPDYVAALGSGRDIEVTQEEEIQVIQQ